MQYKIFLIPASGNEQSEEKLNIFLRTNKIISVCKQFICEHTPAWCFLVEYIEDSSKQHLENQFQSKSTKKIDYMQILTHEEFAFFTKLREFRKKNAEQEKIPAYAVFTDEQLYKIVKTMPSSVKELENVEGIGQSKAQKYGSQVITILTAASDTSKTNSEQTQNEDEKIPF